ncbi:MAG TPA: NAD(P)-dependent oxidoreductase [Polyangiaceae bacterium]|jgi:nucleoside-diphosphate-sugar epimerase|nr:NAD(P)-dependent oxidoreductase [Polyangiaceae bacterium]
MRIFIAGGTGAIGRRLVPLLVNAGHEVLGTTRNAEGVERLRALGARGVVADAFDRERLIDVAREFRPEGVVHQLTDLSRADTEANARLRIEGTRNLVDAAHAAGARFLVAQSIAWVYASGDGPAVETEPLDIGAEGARGKSVEGITRLEGAVAEVADHSILRYGLLYGPDTWYARDGAMARKAASGELVADDSVSSFIHVDDAANACARSVAERARGDAATRGAVNVCDDEPAPASEWVPEFARAVGAPSPKRATGGPPWARGADNRRAREELRLVLRHPSWRDGFRSL